MVQEKKASFHAKLPNEDQWHEVYKKLGAEIKIRHYSPKTLKAYSIWTRKFQHFMKNKAPDLLTFEDVKGFLTSLAVDKRIRIVTKIGVQRVVIFFATLPR